MPGPCIQCCFRRKQAGQRQDVVTERSSSSPGNRIAAAAIFIWFAENIGTFTQTWLYPSQRAGWSPVGVQKLGSWFLLQIVSYALVICVRRPQPPDAEPVRASKERHEKRLARG